jgi:uncharacterized membrane protein YhaH (DUF805 family)
LGWIDFLFRWNGRIGRGQFLVWFFAAGFVSTILSMILVFAFVPQLPGGGWLDDTRFWSAWSIGQFPGWLAQASLAARRLHDLGRSAWFIVACVVYVTALQSIYSVWHLNEDWLDLVLGLPIVAAALWLFATPGEPHENRYGLAPTTE